MNPRLVGALVAVLVAFFVGAGLYASRSAEEIPSEPLRVETAAVAPGPRAIAKETVTAAGDHPPPAAQRPAPGSPAAAQPAPQLAVPQRPPLPRTLYPPVANYTPDGGVRFPLSGLGIQSAVVDAKPQLRECYEGWAKLNANLGGQLKVAFRITGDAGTEAHVDQVRLVGDAGTGHLAFEGCVLSVMSSLKFDPPPGGSLNVTYPLTFSTDGGS